MRDRERSKVKTPQTVKGNPAHKTWMSVFLQSGNAPIQRIPVLHKTVGNLAVQRLFESGILQKKLTIGKPDDIYEQEADRVAEQVMRMPEPAVQKKPG